MQICISVTGGGSKNQPDFNPISWTQSQLTLDYLPVVLRYGDYCASRKRFFLKDYVCAGHCGVIQLVASEWPRGPRVSWRGGRGLAACSMRWDDGCKTVRGFLLMSALFRTLGSVSALHSLPNISSRHYHLAFIWFCTVLCTRSSQTCRPLRT